MPKGTKGRANMRPAPAPDPPASLRNVSLSDPQPEMEAPSLLRDERPVDDGSADYGRSSGSVPSSHDGAERADRYLEELINEVGQPSPKAVAEAEALWDRIEGARTAGAVA